MTRITFASNWEDRAGTKYAGGDTANIDPPTARDLIARGKARAALAAEPPAPAAEHAASTPEPTTEAEPTGPVQSAQVKSRGKTKEVPADG
ncbi:hypothetical protein H490_0103905 [Leucobacter sp. UCD-THU]|uniref:hypothetical protein n=1 Tax=Leucobacter sp. UCD-THU TaxID=1292023 RepID=UPI00035F3BDA|nr:hypothetical protein [Leucobacter sp. UCD-THU]EYT56028.1 hypothetical protein H490_0103905 [Leucobacter sp. UCD-THU]